MNRDILTPVNRDALLETLAAELTLAAYRVALRTRTEGTWLDLELDLWRTLADTARTWEQELARCREAMAATLLAFRGTLPNWPTSIVSMRLSSGRGESTSFSRTPVLLNSLPWEALRKSISTNYSTSM